MHPETTPAEFSRPLLFTLVPSEQWDYISPLTDDERIELERVAAGSPLRFARLPRLFEPLKALWTRFEERISKRVLTSSWYAAARVFAMCVHAFGTMPGWWSSEQWSTFISSFTDTHSMGGLLIAYLVGEVHTDVASGRDPKTGRTSPRSFPRIAQLIFGKEYCELETRLVDTIQRIGYSSTDKYMKMRMQHIVSVYVLRKRSLTPEAGDVGILRNLLQESYTRVSWRSPAFGLWHALNALGMVEELPPRYRRGEYKYGPVTERDTVWAEEVDFWHSKQARLAKNTADRAACQMRVFGRWFAAHCPHVRRVADLDAEACEAFVLAVSGARIGMFGEKYLGKRKGKAMTAYSKSGMLATARLMVREFVRFKMAPRSHGLLLEALALPRHVAMQVSNSEVRDIDELVYVKLMVALEELTAADIGSHYSLSMVKAIGHVLLFTALRKDEIRRLSVSCLDENPSEYDDVVMLHVPVNKTSPAFDKPVAIEVLHAVRVWEAERPDMQRQLEDRKTELLVDVLFMMRDRAVGEEYVNNHLLRLLCKKAGLPQHDAKGKITAHRCRSTMATLLANAPDPMGLLALKVWLGHKSERSTARYARVKMHSLQRVYQKSMSGLSVQVEGFVDLLAPMAVSDATRSRRVLYTDLGNGQGLCGQDAPLACPHSMNCPGCAHHHAEDEPLVRRLRRRDDAVAVLQQFTLTQDQARELRRRRRADAESLMDVPTPDGRTPREIMLERSS